MPPGLDLILMIVAMVAIFYFLIIRPQKKRMAQHQEMQAAIGVGQRVLLTSGMFATVVHVGERQLIVELAPGAEVTVLKGNVARVANPDEEEFEFDDQDATDAADDFGDDAIADADRTVTDEDLEKMFGSDDKPEAEGRN